MIISLKKQTAMAAFGLVRPTINNFLLRYGKNHLERTYLHLVILDKNMAFDESAPETMILHKEGFTLDEDKWKDAPFPDYAREAAYLAYRREVRGETDLPTFTDGDSVIYHDIIVGVSGLQNHFNEMCAMWLATTYHGLTVHYDKLEVSLKCV